MSVTIRLSIFGKKNRPVYRIVVSETRSKRNGRFLDELGIYNPNVQPPIIKINRQKLEAWKKKGAIVSDGLNKLLRQEAAPAPSK